MRTKEDILSVWHDYIVIYKHIRANIGKWLDEKHPLPFNELYEVFGDTLDEEIRGHYNSWVRDKRARLYNIAYKNGLSIFIDDDSYQLVLQEQTQGVSLNGFVGAMGLWCVRGNLQSYIPKSVRVDEVNLGEILDKKFNTNDYDELYKSITDSIDLLHFRLKDDAISKTVTEINELVDDMTDDCAKFMEDVYKSKFDEAIRLLQDLAGDTSYAEGVALIYKFLADGDFNHWYYGGIHGRGNSILNIVGYVEALKNRERLD